MINLLELNKNFNGIEIYKVWKPTINHLPDEIFYDKFTECHFSKYSLKGPDEHGMVDFECEIRGVDKKGKDVDVCSFSGRIDKSGDSTIKKIFFLNINEAIKEKERLISNMFENLRDFNKKQIEILQKNKNLKIE